MRKDVRVDRRVWSLQERPEVTRRQIPGVHFVDVRQYRHHLAALVNIIERYNQAYGERKEKKRDRRDPKLSTIPSRTIHLFGTTFFHRSTRSCKSYCETAKYVKELYPNASKCP